MKLLSELLHMSSRRFVTLVVALYLLLSLPLLLKWPAPMADEAVFANTARTMVENGHLGTSLVPGLESHVYWQPPLYFLTLGPVIKIVGYHLGSLRLFSVLIGAVVLMLVFLVGNKFGDIISGKMAILILVCDPYFVKYVKYVRMDGLCVVFVLAALVVFLYPLFERRSTNLLATGILLTLASLTHPLGLISTLVFLTYALGEQSLQISERLRNAFLIVVPLVIGVILWGVYVLQDPTDFIHQIAFQLTRKDRPLIPSVVNAIVQYRNFPLSLAIPLVGLVYVMCLGKKEGPGVRLLAWLQLAIMITVLLKSEVPYHVYTASVGSIAAGMLLAKWWGGRRKIVRYASAGTVCVLLLNTVLVSGYLNYLYHFGLARETDYEMFCKAVGHNLSLGSTVCLWGTPSLYWGLYSQRQDVRLVEAFFVDSLKAVEMAKGVDYLVSTRSFSPELDSTVLQEQYEIFAGICSKSDRELRLTSAVGTVERFAYSAEIYRTIPKK